MRRRFERHTAVLKVEPATLAELEQVFERDVLTGNIFVPSPLDLPRGAAVVVYVAHPVTAQPFLLEGSVLQRTDAPRGLKVELRRVDRDTKEEFLDFVRGGIFIDDEVVLDAKS